MDEVVPHIEIPGVDVDGADDNPLYPLIDGILDDCAVELYSVAPYWRLPQTRFADSDISVDAVGDRYVIRLRLNDSFLRVAEINCTAFKRPITEVVTEQSPEGKRQHNKFLMGKETKPVGVLSFGEWPVSLPSSLPTPMVGCREIDCYSVSTQVEKSTIVASYIAMPVLAGPVSIPFPDTLIPALEWLAAARAFGARGDVNHAAICQQNAQNLIM